MLGYFLLTVSAIGQSAGTFLADFNETHVKNPRWPPHARFHNGQTMSMAVGLTLLTLYYTYRPVPVAAKADSLFTAALMGSLFFVTGLSAIFYPGSKAMDPEFGEGFPQLPIFLGMLACTWAGWWWETRSLPGHAKEL